MCSWQALTGQPDHTCQLLGNKSELPLTLYPPFRISEASVFSSQTPNSLHCLP